MPVPAHAHSASLWHLNGSTIGLTTDGPSLAFRYQKPRAGMRDEGVRSGTLLFSGTRSGSAISGTGYVFSRRCGALPYPVSGVAVDERNIRLYGSSPIALDRNCRPLKFQHDVNEFTLLKQIAAPVVSVIPAETGDSLAAAEQERQLEEQRLAEVQAFSDGREACRGLDIAACDVALTSPHASADDAAALRAWREAAAVLATAVQDCQTASTSACNTALAFPVLSDDKRTRVMAWKQQASYFAKVRAYVDDQFAAIKATIAPISAEFRYRPPSPQVVNALAAAAAFTLMTFLMSLALRDRHVLAKARSAANGLASSARDLSATAQAQLPHVAEAAEKCWNWFVDPLVAPPPAMAADAPQAVPPVKRAVKHRDTPGALAAMQLANAYIDEVRDQSAPGFDEEHLRKHQLNTLSLAAKQLDRAEALDPDAVLEGEDKDGVTFRYSVNELKSEAMLIEGLTHQIYDTKRAVRALTRATELNLNSPNAFFVLGLVHATNHNKQRAVQALSRAVALDPGNLSYRKELNRIENMTAAEIAAYKTTRGAEHVFDAGIKVANAGIGVYNGGVMLWNIFAFTYNVLTWPLRLVLRIAG